MDTDEEDLGHESDLIDFKLEGLVRLTQLVRSQYCTFLERQLRDNARAWRMASCNGMDEVDGNVDTELINRDVSICAAFLEEKAVKACMVAQLYQRTMMKIISAVRRKTQECRLEKKLQDLIATHNTKAPFDKAIETQNNSCNFSSKATQTDSTVVHQCAVPFLAPVAKETEKDDVEEDVCSISLQKKIEMFQQRLNTENVAKVVAIQQQHKHFKEEMRHYTQRHKRRHEHNSKRAICEKVLKTSTSKMATRNRTPTPIPAAPVTNESIIIEDKEEEEEDKIAKELALLFSEEKTELDDIFGIDNELDDPQISCILKEIENSKMTHEVQATSFEPVLKSIDSPAVETKLLTPPKKPVVTDVDIESTLRTISDKPNKVFDLRNSVWPCELYMQRRRLTASLSRLIEEDFRWHELIKWRFTTLFGEDSDDEFATYSPSIELDEVLIGSCVRRISPWLVKHLMKPMRDGLIANRFLFKKLAKKLAHSIVMENQYPDERLIKKAVAHFFCLHQAVASAEDLNGILSISFNNEDNI